jgi:D-cysteine desulfhydrase
LASLVPVSPSPPLRPAPAPLGVYPTPVERIDALSGAGATLWVKRDDLTHAVYGGNKVRKLEHLFDEARAQKKTRLVTIGAAGSHHVLATTLHGARAGFAVDAIMVAQPRTDHVVANLRAAIAHGARVHPARTWAAVPWLVWRALGPDAYFVTAGGSNVAGSMGYVDAARELAAQVRAGAMPEPDLLVVTLGSGGTAAGLVAGLALEGLRTRVVAVAVATPPWLLRLMALRLARQCVVRAGGVSSRASLASRFVLDARYVGAGYGHATPWGARAIEIAARPDVGLLLDATYTAKTFAAALDLVTTNAAPTILYWHTLSSAPMVPLLAAAPDEASLEARVRGLLR